MTPFVDDMTAILVSLSAFVVGGIMVLHSLYSVRRVGWLITGLAGCGVGVVYILVPLLSIRIEDIREVLRLMLFIFMLNYAILHRYQTRNELRRLYQDIKQWRLHRKLL